MDRAGAGVELSGDRVEEAAAGEDPVLGVAEPGVAERQHPADAGRDLLHRLDHLVDVDPGGGADGGELQLLLGAEQGEDTALAQGQLRGQPSQGQRLQSLHRRDLRGPGQDQASGLVAALDSVVRPAVLACGWHAPPPLPGLPCY